MEGGPTGDTVYRRIEFESVDDRLSEIIEGLIRDDGDVRRWVKEYIDAYDDYHGGIGAAHEVNAAERMLRREIAKHLPEDISGDWTPEEFAEGSVGVEFWVSG